MARKTTSLKINEDLWKQVKIKCIKKDKEISEYLEDLIKKDMKKNKK